MEGIDSMASQTRFIITIHPIIITYLSKRRQIVLFSIIKILMNITCWI